jgi:hypothetical protein
MGTLNLDFNPRSNTHFAPTGPDKILRHPGSVGQGNLPAEALGANVSLEVATWPVANIVIYKADAMM